MIMKKKNTVRDLITYLLDFNMDAEVLVNANGIPVPFDISWFVGGDGSDKKESMKKTTEVHFNIKSEN